MFKGGDPEKIKESQKKRYAKVELVDEVIELDQEWRKGRFVCGLKRFVIDGFLGCFEKLNLTLRMPRRSRMQS